VTPTDVQPDGAVRRHCIVIVETEYINEALWNTVGTDVTGTMKARPQVC
jgi:hypothetical protein